MPFLVTLEPAMKVFISWSGDKSRVIAEILRDWLPTIVQSLEPFLSTQDIPAGGRGMNVLASELETCSFGILCLTRDNKNRPWVNFEAGAISKTVGASSVVPLLLDLGPNEITGPITQFQAIQANNRSEIYTMVKLLAELSSPPRITEQSLARTFDIFWPEFQASVAKMQSEPDSRQEIRTDRDMLEEVLTISRRTERELTRVGQIRTAEHVLASRKSASREPATWWGPLTRRIVSKIMSELRGHTASSVSSYIIDDSGIHIIISSPDGEDDLLELQNIFAVAANRYLVPIHVRGGPIGDESFEVQSPWEVDPD